MTPALRRLSLTAASVLRQYPLRTSIAVASIAAGIFSLVVVLGLSQSLRDSLADSFNRLGSRAIIVRSDPSYDDIRTGDARRLTLADLEYLDRHVPGVRAIAPRARYQGWKTEVRRGTSVTHAALYGSTTDLLVIADMRLASGRFLTAADERNRAPVCVAGSSTAKRLAGGASVLGSWLTVAGIGCKVVGVLHASGSVLGFDQDSMLILPMSTLLDRVPDASQIDLEIHLLFDAAYSDATAAATVRGALVRGEAIERRPRPNFLVITGEAIGAYFDQTLGSIKLGLLGLVLITFLIGGAGVMNVMLATVRARTAEIGLRRAVGASRANIFTQFTVEAMTVSILGGAVGCVAAFLALAIVTRRYEYFGHSALSWQVFALAAGLSVASGILSGVWPALRASRLDPTVALRRR